MTAIRREELKVTRSLKEAAKKGDKDVCKILARWEGTTSRTIIDFLFREVVNSRKAVNKIYAAKANLNSVQMQMKTQLAQVIFLSISEVIWRNKLQPLKFVRKELVTRVGIFRPKLRALSQAAPM